MPFPVRKLQVFALAALVASGLEPLAAQVAAPSAVPLRAYDQGFREPVRLATDAAGRLYASDARLNLVTVREENGHLLRVKRGLSRPLGLAVDGSGRIFVCEAGRGRVSLFTSAWVEAGALGQGDGEFQMPNHITLGPDGLVYVVDSAAALVKVYGADGLRLRQFGGPGRAAGQFDFPTGLALAPTGELFVSDQGNERIQVFDSSGTFLRMFGGTVGMTGANTTFGRVQGLLADGQGRIYLADAFRGKVTVINAAGSVLGTIGEFGTGPGQLMGPASLALDGHGRLFVAAPGNARVEVYGLDTHTDPNLLSARIVVAPADLDRTATTRGAQLELPRRKLAPWELDDPQDEGPRFRPIRTALVSVLIKIPGIAPSAIRESSLRANGVPASRTMPGAMISDFDGDGSFEFRAWFDQRRLVATMPDGEAFLLLTGLLSDGRPFESIAEVRVLTTAGGGL